LWGKTCYRISSQDASPQSAGAMIDPVDELAALGARFVCWRWETRNGKATKPPLTAAGDYASTTDPTTWAGLGEAMEAVQSLKLDGIGFVLDAWRDRIVDLDSCRNAETSAIAPWAQKIINSLRSYAEVSPSGTGGKILVKVDPVPNLRANKRTVGKANGAEKLPAVEIYAAGRYFCLTGDGPQANQPPSQTPAGALRPAGWP
jgi:putative DNA primase/helicase